MRSRLKIQTLGLLPLDPDCLKVSGGEETRSRQSLVQALEDPLCEMTPMLLLFQEGYLDSSPVTSM